MIDARTRLLGIIGKDLERLIINLKIILDDSWTKSTYGTRKLNMVLAIDGYLKPIKQILRVLKEGTKEWNHLIAEKAYWEEIRTKIQAVSPETAGDFKISFRRFLAQKEVDQQVDTAYFSTAA